MAAQSLGNLDDIAARGFLNPEGARACASMGLDPNVWFGRGEVAAGRSTSREPMVYVRNILKYYTSYRIFEALGQGATGGAAPG